MLNTRDLHLVPHGIGKHHLPIATFNLIESRREKGDVQLLAGDQSSDWIFS